MLDVSVTFSNIWHLTSNICIVCKLKAGEIQDHSKRSLSFCRAEGHM